eukprot:7827057-Lingulodinium_polyedra.AAC.1
MRTDDLFRELGLEGREAEALELLRRDRHHKKPTFQLAKKEGARWVRELPRADDKAVEPQPAMYMAGKERPELVR